MAGLSANARQIASAVKRGLHMMQGWSRLAARFRDVRDVAAYFIGATTSMISECLAAAAILNARGVLTFCAAGFATERSTAVHVVTEQNEHHSSSIDA
jgi:hypothetical protein